MLSMSYYEETNIGLIAYQSCPVKDKMIADTLVLDVWCVKLAISRKEPGV